jgi:membrane protein required for colicin V production
MEQAAAFNWIDLSVLGIIGFSILIGILRGATREVLGIAAWIGAFATVFYGLPLLRPFARHYISNPMVADVIIAVLLFILSLGVFIFISRMISSRIKFSILGGVDRALGLVFGFVRGVFLVCLIYLAMGFFYTPEQVPDDVKTARSTPYLAQGALELKRLIPKDYLPQDISKKTIHPLNAKDLIENTLPTLEETVKNLSTLKPASPKKTEAEDDVKQKEDLNKLIDAHDPETQK